MAGYKPEQLGIKAPAGGFQDNGWYNGRNYDAATGTFGEPNQNWSANNPDKNKGQVSQEVVGQSAAAQGKTTEQFNQYFAQEAARSRAVTPTAGTPGGGVPGGAGIPGMGEGGGLGITQNPTLNLPDMYKNLYAEAGISDIEKKLAEKEQRYNEAASIINDDPFLSEARRTGRQQKLSTDYQNAVRADQNALAMKKADIDKQIEIATQQFNINSQQAQFALQQFNSLLSSGALAGASGADIANITSMTGISSGMIQSAIAAQKEKDRQTTVTTVDDGTSIKAVVLDTKTGEIINSQVVGQSKPSSAKASAAETQQAYKNLLISDVRGGNLSVPQIMGLYTGYLDFNTILNLYNANSPHGPAKEDTEQLRKVYDVGGGKTLSPTDQYFQGLLSGEGQ